MVPSKVTPEAKKVDVPADFVTYIPFAAIVQGSKNQGANLRFSPVLRLTQVGVRIRPARLGDDFSVVLRSIRVKDFDASRTSLLELVLDGDPVQIRPLQSRFGLEGYQVSLTAYDRERPSDCLIGSTFSPILAIDAHRFAMTPAGQPELVLLLIWLEPRTPGMAIENIKQELEAFLAGFSLEKPF
jgi:hypothetical protein